MNPCEFLHFPIDTTREATQGGGVFPLVTFAGGPPYTQQVFHGLSVTGMARAGDSRW